MATPWAEWLGRAAPTANWLRSAGPLRVQVFLAGAGIMVLEMLGGRLLAPRFGSTIFTWGALIGVVMTALAAGYYAGGRLGDRLPRASTLSLLLFGGAAFALLMPLLAPPTLAAVAAAFPDPRGGPIVATLLLIAPPSMALGAATPVAIRLAGGSSERAGSVAGSMAGLATVGSIAGTFLTVFVLIPVFEVWTILLGTGAVLGAASLLTASSRPMLAGALVLLLVGSPMTQGALAPTLAALQTGITDDVLYSKSTPYHELYVVQDRVPFGGSHVRTLILDGNWHSAMYTERPAETPIRYVEFFHLGPLLHPNASKVLFVGAGGMSGPKQFLQLYPNMSLHVVEIDPDVVDVARRYFAVPEDPRLTVSIADGRQFLQQTDERWDLIVLDAYGRSYVPFHLLTVEFLGLARERLAPGGLIVSNLIGSEEGDASLLLRSAARTMKATFPWTREAPTHPEFSGSMAQNVMLFAAVEEPQGWANATERAIAWEQERGRRYPVLFSTMREAWLSGEGVPILRDNYAPVEAFLSPLTMRPYDPEG